MKIKEADLFCLRRGASLLLQYQFPHFFEIIDVLPLASPGWWIMIYVPELFMELFKLKVP